VNGASLAAPLGRLLSDVPAALLDAEGAARLAAGAWPLPAGLAGGPVGLELRLAGPAHADLFVAAAPAAATGEALLAWAAGDGRPVLRPLAQALAEWRAGAGWLAAHATFVLLELDAATDPLAPPSVYLAPRGAADAGPVEASRNAFHADPEGLVGVLAALAGVAPDPMAGAELARLLGALPPYAEIFAAGAMLSRASAAAPRIAVRRLWPSGLERILGALDRAWAAELLAPLARQLEPLGCRFILALDLGADAADLVGLEVHAGRYWTEGRADGWAPVLEALVARGLAEPERAAAALTLPRPGPPVLGLSHVKVLADPKGLRPAKLYLGADRLVVGREPAPAPARSVAV
jgi:hypothetical protein